jgi:DNA-binding transcriptional LysR family regulator
MKPYCYHSFDLRQLVSFAEIARTGSFRQAAKTLHIVQPALSRQIKQLEAALGIYLFDRSPLGTGDRAAHRCSDGIAL